MINKDKIELAREILSKEIQDNTIEMSETHEFNILLDSAGYLDSLLNILKRKSK